MLAALAQLLLSMFCNGDTMHHQSPILRWRNYPELYRLEGNQCSECEKIYFPKKHLCFCGSMTFHPLTLKGSGKLLSFTQIKAPPEIFSAMAPYCIGIIDLDEGPRITGQLTDCTLHDLHIGMRVTSVFRKMYAVGEEGIIHYGIKFTPLKTL